MLLAYIDEIGQTGAFVHPTHPRYSDSPSFGYGGFIISADNAREFGAHFAGQKKRAFSSEIPDGVDPGRWEKKGADLLFAKAPVEMPQNLRILGGIIGKLRSLDGHLFYYSEEKPKGTPREVNTGSAEYEQREEVSMRETLNRLARHASHRGERLIVMMDQINEKSRKQRLPKMYAHILGRAAEYEEMRRIIEPPMHIDSELSANIQFADWVCALVKRAIEYQLVPDSRYSWVPSAKQLSSAKGAFTHESKLRLFQSSLKDLHHSEVMYAERPVVDTVRPFALADDNRRKLELVRKASFHH